MKLRKTQLAAAVGAALLIGATAVQAQQAVQGATPLQVQLYGQVNRAMMWADDGVSNRWFFADGEPSGTRFGITGTSQIAPGLRAGARFEVEYQSNSSDAVSFATPSVNPGFAERWFDVSLGGAWGEVRLGQGEPAADNASTIDLSGTNLINGVCVCDWGGSIEWRTAGGGLLGATLGDTHNNQDFESRYDRLMYATPVFGGLRAQVSTGQKGEEVNEVGLYYTGKIAGDLQAGIGWSEEKNAAFKDTTLGGSISWLSAAGFSVTLAYTEKDRAANREGTQLWGKLGYKFGAHAVSVSYGIFEDQDAAGDEGTAIGAGWVWNPQRWIDVYAGAHLYTLELGTGGDAEDITVFAIGTRVRW